MSLLNQSSDPSASSDVSFHIVGDAYIDFFCFLDGEWPENGGDSRLNQPVKCHAGGSSTNTATHLKSLLHFFAPMPSPITLEDTHDTTNGNNNTELVVEPSVKLHTVLNPYDHYGQILLDHAEYHGFPIHNCWTEEDAASNATTGHCIAIISGGERSFMTHQGVVENFDASHINIEEMIDAPTNLHLHIAGFYNIPGFWNGKLQEKVSLIRKQRQRRHPHKTTTVSLVTQHDATKVWDGGLKDLLLLLDFVIMNDLEAQSIVKQGGLNVENYEHEHLCWAEYFGALDKTCNVIVTRGEKGAIALRDKQILGKQKPIVVKAIDPTGAGDSFTAGFIHGLWSWKRAHPQSPPEQMNGGFRRELWPLVAIEEGMRWGVSVGSAAVLIRGASIPPKGEDIQAFLEQAKEPEYPIASEGYYSAEG
ncbi:sugar kinase [Nitzschia inconspicua]|uniref:Sugar kinase n=1 Tax=Nitzschia inconspicua TaxID=303405 RepID=A0A9K3PAM3_9STRA|nr:sugar kinase [Nitzschia inconspicua]KAG7340482.1 sugar kinase [Nitzschia inconspicua]